MAVLTTNDDPSRPSARADAVPRPNMVQLPTCWTTHLLKATQGSGCVECLLLVAHVLLAAALVGVTLIMAVLAMATADTATSVGCKRCGGSMQVAATKGAGGDKDGLAGDLQIIGESYIL